MKAYGCGVARVPGGRQSRCHQPVRGVGTDGHLRRDTHSRFLPCDTAPGYTGRGEPYDDPAQVAASNIHRLPSLDGSRTGVHGSERLALGGDLTQAQIATRVGLSQMHVSRLLKWSLAQLKAGMVR
ncbi:sigma factor-like helix-turn-helix DNA-binding protein [Micromonospora mirobrigensis]|uniref:Sigma-70, region 4 n=1 Tax=Micromonospora mirobrigensis TaxID=262898 RepID=A0A1C4YX35_9ACTN|nr:Sigma-70, region 4 [Micromonospora mirobrigensis]